jgi:CRISPR/Cas system-associated exonuclease Cas4 (RecB family)
MKTLTLDSIKDFQICERLYDYRHNDKILEKVYSRDLMAQRFESTIKNILFFYWFKKQGGVTPSYSSLLNRWEKLWFPKSVDVYDIAHDQHESHHGNMASYTTKAAALLLRFHEVYSDADLIPIGISESYISVLGNEIKIEDKIDLIYRKNGINYVTKFLFNYKSKNSFMYQIDFTFMYLGFKLQHPSQIGATKFGYIDFASNNFEFVQYEITQEDVDSLTFWANSICEKEVFIPRRGLTSYCKKCPFDSICAQWKFSSATVSITEKK